MSTILDALKKSEQERRLNDVPTLSDMPAPHEKSKWTTAALFLVFLGVMVLIGLVVKNAWFSTFSGFATPFTQEERLNEVEPSSDEVASTDAAKSSLAINVVSYSSDPDKRFVMINGDLFREGEFVKAGIKVEEIRQDDVVLNSRGEKIVRRP